MKFFFDNCVSHRLAEALDHLEASERPPAYSITHLRTKYPEEEGDLDWIPKLGAEGDWIVVGGDGRQLIRRKEMEALRKASLRGFILAQGYPQRVKWEQVRILVIAWPRILHFSQKLRYGQFYKVTARGGVEPIGQL